MLDWMPIDGRDTKGDLHDAFKRPELDADSRAHCPQDPLIVLANGDAVINGDDVAAGAHG